MKKSIGTIFAMTMMAEAMMADTTLADRPYFIEKNETPQIHLPKHRGNSIRIEVRTTPKVGANQSCPCGSGLKNKKCCKLSRLPKKETNENIQA
jgi:uncharacterized protein YecA (UPF0149 family)